MSESPIPPAIPETPSVGISAGAPIQLPPSTPAYVYRETLLLVIGGGAALLNLSIVVFLAMGILPRVNRMSPVLENNLRTAEENRDILKSNNAILKRNNEDLRQHRIRLEKELTDLTERIEKRLKALMPPSEKSKPSKEP